MKQLKINNQLTVLELKEKVRASINTDSYRRWQAILMISTLNLKAEEIASIIGVARTTIYKWVQIYNNEGIETYACTPRGGRRRSLMSLAEEEKILKNISKKSEAGFYINANKIRAEVEKYLGKKVSKDYAYDLLHRHNWRKIVPRPTHPKKDKVKQEEYKKNFRNLWMKQ